ncbi:MAG: secondary thiamine-phosphate synthase enzyme YjbQ [Deltaproteobacteria bacterium]|nr:secondary thiamine-phosphate synthase enzyme YjbQ [Deltaproteobacteria bacterium]
MKLFKYRITKKTKGEDDLIDITSDVRCCVKESGAEDGFGVVFVVGSTASILTMEYESGLAKDVREFLGELIPKDRDYLHNATWDDDNGYSHLRATLLGQSFVFPIENNEPVLGRWQQIVLAEFDHRPRDRVVVVHIYKV